jgi:hypothetical protein
MSIFMLNLCTYNHLKILTTRLKQCVKRHAKQDVHNIENKSHYHSLFHNKKQERRGFTLPFKSI